MEISLNRIWLLCRKQWVDHQRMYLLGVIAIGGIMLAAYLVITLFPNPVGLDTEFQNILFLFGIVFFGTVFTSTLLSQLSEKNTGIQTLLLPASGLEKIIVMILFSNVIFPLAYGLVVYPVVLGVHYIDVQVRGNINNLMDFSGYFLMALAIFFFLAQNLMLLCSIVFKRYAFIKTAILACTLTLLFFLLNQQIASSLVGNRQPKQEVVLPSDVKQFLSNDPSFEKSQSDITYKIMAGAPFINLKFWVVDRTIAWVELPESQMWTLNIVFYGCMVILLWLATWFRFREKEL